MVGAEGPVISREYSEFTEVEFIMETDGIFQFVGWTIDSKLYNMCFWNIACNIMSVQLKGHELGVG